MTKRSALARRNFHDLRIKKSLRSFSFSTALKYLIRYSLQYEVKFLSIWNLSLTWTALGCALVIALWYMGTGCATLKRRGGAYLRDNLPLSHTPRPIEAHSVGSHVKFNPRVIQYASFVNSNPLHSLPRRVHSNHVTTALHLRNDCAQSTKYSLLNTVRKLIQPF